MPHSSPLTAFFLSVVSLAVACGDDDERQGEPHGGASGVSGSAGASGEGTGGSLALGGSEGSAQGGDPGEGGLGGAGAGAAGATESGGDGAGGDGGQGGALAQAERWLAFQVEMQDDYTHPLFIAPVPAVSAPIEVAADVGFWQWTPDGTKLLYATPANYQGPSNAAYSVDVTPSGLGAPKPLHEPLAPNTYASVSLSPNGETLALRLQVPDGELYLSSWYLRPIDGAPDDWALVAEGLVAESFIAPVRFAWSPDGTRAAIVEPEDDTYDSLVIVDVAGQSTQASFEDLNLVQWSADGSRLFVEGLYDGPSDQRVLYAIDADAAYGAIQVSEPAVHSAFDLSSLAVSSDGSTVAFEASSAGDYALFVKDVDGAEPAVKVDTQNAQKVVWSASYDRFLYQSYVSAAPVGPHLFAVPRQGGEATRLNPDETIAYCNVAPCLWEAGDALVFATSDHDYAGNQLYDIDLSGPSPSARRLTDFAAGTFLDSVSLAPETSRVLLFVTNASSDCGIYEIDRSTASPSATPLLSFARGVNPSPVAAPWSSDSTFIALTADHDRDPNGTHDLFVARIEGGTTTLSEPVMPSDGSFFVTGAAWQP